MSYTSAMQLVAVMLGLNAALTIGATLWLDSRGALRARLAREAEERRVAGLHRRMDEALRPSDMQTAAAAIADASGALRDIAGAFGVAATQEND